MIEITTNGIVVRRGSVAILIMQKKVSIPPGPGWVVQSADVIAQSGVKIKDAMLEIAFNILATLENESVMY
jgi:hypothetical protein